MKMPIYETDGAGLEKFYAEVRKRHETYAPVESFGRYSYRSIGDSDRFFPKAPIEKSLSIKPLFLPQTSEVMRFRENRDGVQILPRREDPLSGKKVVLGVKMCDAQGMQALDRVAGWDYIDGDYLKRRENAILVAVACDKAGKNCFCDSLDFDLEKSDAFDVLIFDGMGRKVLLKGVSQKGSRFLEEMRENLTDAPDTADGQIQDHFRKFRESSQRRMNYPAVHESVKEKFEAPEFDDFAKVCIGCNTCSFICPTCHCFKVVDEKVKESGVRYKCYDACACSNFTLMAGGHNPRPEKRRRWRQRAMHKFVYYKERFGTNLCVGCGRCVSFCPVNIDIFDVVTRIEKGVVDREQAGGKR